MNKAELIDYMINVTDLTKKQAEQALQAFGKAIVHTLQKGETIGLIGLGTFGTKQSAAREGVHPKTRQKLLIPASTKVYFKAGKKLKDAAMASENIV